MTNIRSLHPDKNILTLYVHSFYLLGISVHIKIILTKQLGSRTNFRSAKLNVKGRWNKFAN